MTMTVHQATLAVGWFIIWLVAFIHVSDRPTPTSQRVVWRTLTQAGLVMILLLTGLDVVNAVKLNSPPPSLLEKAARYNEVEALYRDERFTNGHGRAVTRRFIEAVRWSTWIHGDQAWGHIMGFFDARDLGVNGRGFWWSEIVRGDLPRWEPDGFPNVQGGCEHVLQAGPRQGGRCGKHPMFTGRVTDPETGHWRMSGWCSVHREPGRVVLYRESRRDKAHDPEPTPNRGGLLPCYLVLVEKTWEEEYRAVSHGSWTLPTAGVCADDWPDAPLTTVPRPRLTLVKGGLA